jgi:glycosyltransferase involved in cell wall biosynthesis
MANLLVRTILPKRNSTAFFTHTKLIFFPTTGFHASTEEQFAEGFAKALELPSSEALAMRLRSRESAKRFSEEVFSERWLKQLDALVALETMVRSEN